VAGKLPVSKGQLPFLHRVVSDLATQYPCVAVSQYTYVYLTKVSALEDIDAIMAAYRLYTAQIAALAVWNPCCPSRGRGGW
jgi:flagellar transcriptional activator FlhC